MDCSRHLLGWGHHKWHRRVTHTETIPIVETTMWGGVVQSTLVRCHAEHVCEACGATREEGNCLCDPSRAEHCAVRLACLDRANRTVP